MSNSISLPNKIYFTKEEKFKSEVVIEPLYPGYGVTIGNTLRRVLLSSLPGTAVVAVKIKGVDHEFSTVPNVKEDVVDIILNLKQLRLRVSSEEPVKLELRTKGQKQAKAGDIKPDPRVEIVNPELIIATLDNKNAELSLEITVVRGRGYVPVEMRESEKLEIGTIAVDAIFTPMRNVNYEVQNVRVGQITNYDKLTVTMETDGTITGREALDIASQILVDHFILLKTAKIAEEERKDLESEEVKIEKIQKEEGGTPTKPIEDLATLNLSNRAYNALVRNNIRSVAELHKLTRQDLENLEGLGAKSIDEIMRALGASDAS